MISQELERPMKGVPAYSKIFFSDVTVEALHHTLLRATELATSYSPLTIKNFSAAKALYNPKAFFVHAASLDQAFAHCPKFQTAASRRSLGRVAVPVWRINLSVPLPVIALVGFYPTN